MTDPERYPEDLLDQTLHHLRTAPVPDGLERRILAACATRNSASADVASSRATSQGRFSWSLLRPTLIPAGLSAAVATLFFAVHLHHRAAQPQTPVARAPFVSPPTAIHTPHPEPTHTAAPSMTRPSSRISPSPTQPDADTALALAESTAPSQLAPDLPLTDDERALQHLAQHPSTDALNSLNPARNAAEELAEQAAFHSFFTPPAIPESVLKGESN